MSTLLQPVLKPKLSTQMRAVLMIFNADPYLSECVQPYVDTERDSICWDPLFKMGFGSGHKAAVILAFSIWTDEVRENCNPFDAALSLSPGLQMASIKALALRWGLTR